MLAFVERLFHVQVFPLGQDLQTHQYDISATCLLEAFSHRYHAFSREINVFHAFFRESLHRKANIQ